MYFIKLKKKFDIGPQQISINLRNTEAEQIYHRTRNHFVNLCYVNLGLWLGVLQRQPLVSIFQLLVCNFLTLSSVNFKMLTLHQES